MLNVMSVFEPSLPMQPIPLNSILAISLGDVLQLISPPNLLYRPGVYMMVIIDTHSKYVWDFYLEKKSDWYEVIKDWPRTEVKSFRGRGIHDFEMFLMSDLGEAHSQAIIDECAGYGVTKISVPGANTPQINAIQELWFRTVSEMSRCQMLQFDSPECLWEESRRMATFIYNRVPPSHRTAGEPWLSPHQQLYPHRISCDLSRLKPFGSQCWVHTGKTVSQQTQYHGKSDKIPRARSGILCGYDDSQSSLLARVYFLEDGCVQRWEAAGITYADPLTELEKHQAPKRTLQLSDANPKDFEWLKGTRHIDPDEGLMFQTTDIKVTRDGYIVAYRRRVHNGLMVGKPDGPYHVADISQYTRTTLGSVTDQTDVGRPVSGKGESTAPTDASRASTGESSSVSEVVPTDIPRLATSDVPGPQSISSTQGVLRKRRRADTTNLPSYASGNRSAVAPPSLQPGTRSVVRTLRSRLVSHLAASLYQDNPFSWLVVQELDRRQQPIDIHEALLNAPDFEPVTRRHMTHCAKRAEWEAAEQDEHQSIQQCNVWHKPTTPKPPHVKILPLKWVYRVKKDLNGHVARYKARLVAQGFFQVYGADYTDTYSPVARFTSIRSLLAIAAQLGLHIHQMDVDTAFLNAPITEDIWVQIPAGCLPPGDDGIYKLDRSLYGLTQAPREWNHLINAYLENLGFQRLEADPLCLTARDTYSHQW